MTRDYLSEVRTLQGLAIQQRLITNMFGERVVERKIVFPIPNYFPEEHISEYEAAVKEISNTTDLPVEVRRSLDIVLIKEGLQLIKDGKVLTSRRHKP